jgi:hypothetical protein
MQREHPWLNIYKEARAYLPHIILPTSVLDFHVVIYMLWRTLRIQTTEHMHCKENNINWNEFLSYNSQHLNFTWRMSFTLCSSSFLLIILAVSSFIIVGISSEVMRASARPSHSPTWPRSPGNPESSSHSQSWSYKNYFMKFSYSLPQDTNHYRLPTLASFL